MQNVTPFSTRDEAIEALDNGGRFYNFLTKKDDGEISKAELAKAAGVVSCKQEMLLFLSMAMVKLNEEDRGAVYGILSDDLVEAAKKHEVRYCDANEVVKVEAGESVVVEGIPEHMESRADLSSFIMMPVTTGQLTTYMMIPIYDQYDVYKIKDEESGSEMLVARAKTKERLEPVEMRFGGIVKEMKGKKGEAPRYPTYLQTLYGVKA